MNGNGGFVLSSLDLIILCLYLIGIVVYGLWHGRNHKDAGDYFLAGRSLKWHLIGLSLFASNVSSSTLVGLAGSGYATGFSVFSYEWMAAVVLVIFAVFFLPVYLNTKIYTMPEYLEKRYGPAARSYFSILTILLITFVDTAGTLYAGSLVVQLVFPGLPLSWIILAIAVFAGLYTIPGGLSSVVYTDAVQAVILILGSIVITFIAWDKVGSWEAVEAVTSPGHLTIIKSASDPFLPWPGLITGVLVIGFYFWATNQFIVQRALASKDSRHGQWGALLAGALKLATLFVMVFPGAFAKVLYPDLEKADMVYPTMLFDLLPSGLLGLVFAGFVAALMSSVDSALNSASTLVTIDFYQKWKPGANQSQLLRTGKVVTFVFMVISALWAPQIRHFPSLWDYLQQILAICCPPIVSLFAMGMFWKRANYQGAVAAILTGILAGIFVFANIKASWMPHYLYIAGAVFVLCMLSLVVASLLTPAPSGVQLGAMWSRASYRQETILLKESPWYLNYRVLSILLLVLVAIVLILF